MNHGPITEYKPLNSEIEVAVKAAKGQFGRPMADNVGPKQQGDRPGVLTQAACVQPESD